MAEGTCLWGRGNSCGRFGHEDYRRCFNLISRVYNRHNRVLYGRFTWVRRTIVLPLRYSQYAYAVFVPGGRYKVIIDLVTDICDLIPHLGIDSYFCITHANMRKYTHNYARMRIMHVMQSKCDNRKQLPIFHYQNQVLSYHAESSCQTYNSI